MASSKNLKIVMKSPADLIPYVNNAKIHEPEQIDLIASSMKEFGFTNPILLDGDNGLIAGHGRLMAANKLGLEKVPTIELSHLTPHQKRAYILADNRVAELHTSWDMDLVNLEMEDLELDGFDLGELEFDLIDDGVNVLDDSNDEGEAADEGIDYQEAYSIVVVCKDSGDQEKKYSKLVSEGYECKVLIN